MRLQRSVITTTKTLRGQWREQVDLTVSTSGSQPVGDLGYQGGNEYSKREKLK